MECGIIPLGSKNREQCCLINTDDFAILPYIARQTGIRIIQLRGNLILQGIIYNTIFPNMVSINKKRPAIRKPLLFRFRL